MYQVNIFLASFGKSLDVETQSLSIFGLLDGIGVVAFPIHFPNIVVTTVLNRAESDSNAPVFDLSVEQNGNSLMHFPMTVQFGASLKARSFAQIQGLLLTATGRLTFRLKSGEEELANYPVEVVSVQPPV